MKTISNDRIRTILTVIDAFVTATSLFLCMQLLSDTFSLKDVTGLYLALYLTLAVTLVLRAGLKKTYGQKKNAIFLVVFAVLLTLCGVFFAVEGVSDATVIVGLTVFYAYMIGNCVISIGRAKKHRIPKIVWNLLLIIAIVFGYAMVVASSLVPKESLEQEGLEDFMMKLIQSAGIALPVMLMALGHILVLSFKRMNLGILKKIIQKTFAAEILFGLIMLIIAFSFILQIFDPAFVELNYGDALWYCFAIVTTIGFGDITAVSIVGRILSVILGIYGIIVVALITSIIVNFYSEVKSEPDEVKTEDEDDEAAEEK